MLPGGAPPGNRSGHGGSPAARACADSDANPHPKTNPTSHPGTAGRTGTPAAAMCAFASPIEWVPKWKMEAASTAEAWPSRIPSTKCSRLPTPPEAMTGTGTASATRRVSSMS